MKQLRRAGAVLLALGVVGCREPGAQSRPGKQQVLTVPYPEGGRTY